MWVREVLTDHGVKKVGIACITKIYVDVETAEVQVYTHGGNIYTHKLVDIIKQDCGYSANTRKSWVKNIY